jgi:hypothetical protein
MQSQDIRDGRICNITVRHEGELATLFLELDYGTHKGTFGGYAIDDLGQKTSIGPSTLSMLLEVAGCEKWERLLGHTVRSKIVSGNIVALGHRQHNLWFTPLSDLELFRLMQPTVCAAPGDPQPQPYLD